MNAGTFRGLLYAAAAIVAIIAVTLILRRLRMRKGGLLVVSNVLRGPNAVGDADLIPLLSKIVSVISSAAVNLVSENAQKTDAKRVAKKLVGLSALAAAGEMRSAIVLCTTGLTINSRIHVRSIDDALRRITVYTLDNDFAK